MTTGGDPRVVRRFYDRRGEAGPWRLVYTGAGYEIQEAVNEWDWEARDEYGFTLLAQLLDTDDPDPVVEVTRDGKVIRVTDEEFEEGG